MKRFAPTVLLAALTFAAGCGTPDHVASAPSTHYNSPSEKQLEDRIAELERAGHTREGAEQKARREFASRTWQTDYSQTWAADRARAERSARREKMEKDLAKLDRAR